MKKKKIRKILLWLGGTILFLILVLTVHIYIVTRPKVDKHTQVMARIDLHQPVSGLESGKITGWLYSQRGVDHVLCNPATGIVVFTFSPLKADANLIADHFKSSFHYRNANRFIPNVEELQSSCPVSTSSMYKVIKNIF